MEVVLLLMVVLGLGWVVGGWLDRVRIQQKRQRFVGRERLPLESIYANFPGAQQISFESFASAWALTAIELRIDPLRLRPDDRFANELAPVPGWPVEDELLSLVEIVAQESGKGESPKLETLGEYVIWLASRRSRPPRHKWWSPTKAAEQAARL